MFSKEKLAKMFNLDYDCESGQYTVKGKDILKLSMEYDVKTVNVRFNGLK